MNEKYKLITDDVFSKCFLLRTVELFQKYFRYFNMFYEIA